MRGDVASHCCKNGEACCQWQDVFCTMFGNRSVFEKGRSECEQTGTIVMVTFIHAELFDGATHFLSASQ